MKMFESHNMERGFFLKRYGDRRWRSGTRPTLFMVNTHRSTRRWSQPGGSMCVVMTPPAWHKATVISHMATTKRACFLAAPRHGCVGFCQRDNRLLSFFIPFFLFFFMSDGLLRPEAAKRRGKKRVGDPLQREVTMRTATTKMHAALCTQQTSARRRRRLNEPARFP